MFIRRGITTNKKVFNNIYKSYKWSSVFFRYLVFIILFFVIPTLIAGIFTISYYNEKAELSQKIEYTNMISRCSGIIDNAFSVIYEDSRYLSVDEKIGELLSSDDVLNEKTIHIATESYDTVNDRICDSVYLYSMKSGYVFSYKGFGSNYFEKFADKSWFSRKDEPMPIYRQITYANKSYGFLSLITPISYLNEQVGYAVHNIDTSLLGELMRDNLNSYDCIMLTDKNGLVMYSSDRNLIGTVIDADEQEGIKPAITYIGDEIYISNKLTSNGLNCVIKTPHYSANEQGLNVVAVVVAIMLILIVLAIFLAFVISSNFYNQIQNILNLFNGVHEEKTENGFNEFAYIRMNILELMKKNELTEVQLTARIEQVRETQRILAQSRINSHFLMNTLQFINVVVLSVTKKENEATYVIKMLSDILKSSLDSTRTIIPLEEDISFAKKFVQIVNMRYDGIINVDWKIKEEHKKCYVPKMMLQPIIENAIQHGLLPSRNEKKIVEVISFEEDDSIYIMVSDNGVGFDKEKQDEINNMLSEPVEMWSNGLRKKKHFGLDNTNKCLKLIFGDEYGCCIESEPGYGTKVYIKIKKQNKII